MSSHWRIDIKGNRVFITNGASIINIGRAAVPFYHRMAQQEADRRNRNPQVSDFMFDDKSVRKLLKLGLKLRNEHPLDERYDLVSLCLVRCINNFVPNPDSCFVTYYLSALHRCLSVLQHKKKSKRINKIVNDRLIAKSAYHTFGKERIVVEDHQGLLSHLPARQRMMVKLRYYDGMTYDDIGKLYDVTKQRVEQIVKRSLDSISEYVINGNKTPTVIPTRRARKPNSRTQKVRQIIMDMLKEHPNFEQRDMDRLLEDRTAHFASKVLVYNIRRLMLETGELVRKKERRPHIGNRLLIHRYWSLKT